MTTIVVALLIVGLVLVLSGLKARKATTIIVSSIIVDTIMDTFTDTTMVMSVNEKSREDYVLVGGRKVAWTDQMQSEMIALQKEHFDNYDRREDIKDVFYPALDYLPEWQGGEIADAIEEATRKWRRLQLE